MIANFLPHLLAATLLLTTQLAFANEYRHLQNHSHELMGQVKDLRWLAEDVMVNHPERRSVLRDIDHLRNVARDLDDVIYEQERIGKIVDELNHFEDDLHDLREKLGSRVAGRGRFDRRYGPSVAVGGCGVGSDPVAFLLNKTYELNATTNAMENILGIDRHHHHGHLGGPLLPAYQSPTPVPYHVLPPKYGPSNTPAFPPPLPSQSWSNKPSQHPLSNHQSQPSTINLGGIKLTFAP